MIRAKLQQTSYTVHWLEEGRDTALCGRMKRPVKGGGVWHRTEQAVNCSRCVQARNRLLRFFKMYAVNQSNPPM